MMEAGVLKRRARKRLTEEKALRAGGGEGTG